MQTTSSPSYGAVAKTLHWVIALAVIAMLVIGFVMVGLPAGSDKFALFQWHKSLGLTILILSVLRLFWRLTHKAPPLPAAMPAWEKFAARATHAIFYVLIIGMPLSGWGIVSTSRVNVPTLLYGVIPWPSLPLAEIANRKEIHDMLSGGHGIAAWILVALAILHVAAAHKHHWIDRDDVLTRMAPGPVARLLDRLRGM